MMRKVYLILENGEVFAGNSFGAKKEVSGHIIFNTNMMGYQEIITDPVYADCLVVITYPLIGACGINKTDNSSKTGAARALIIKEYSTMVSNWQSVMSLSEFMKKKGIVGIEGIDTRYLTRYIADNGIIRGIITSNKSNKKNLIKKIQQDKDADIYRRVSCKKPYTSKPAKKTKKKAVVLDLGLNFQLLNWLADRGYNSKVVPIKTSAEKILQEKPDIIVLSNGPGNPLEAGREVEKIKKLLGKKRILGFGLGSSILAMAIGAEPELLALPHYGFNKAVKDAASNKVRMTQQEHRYTINTDSLDKDTKMVSYNLHDETLEAYANKKLKAEGYYYLP
jgi:carbamoyl-phosphate synthase small subunit